MVTSWKTVNTISQAVYYIGIVKIQKISITKIPHVAFLDVSTSFHSDLWPLATTNLSIVYSSNSVIYRQKWNYTICDLLGLAFFFNWAKFPGKPANLWHLISILWFFFFLFQISVIWYICTRVCLTTHWRTFGSFPLFWLLQIKLLWTFVYRLGCEPKVCLLWYMPKSAVAWSFGSCMFAVVV